MGTTFMNCENSKTSDPYRLLLNLLGTISLKRSEKYIALRVLSICYRYLEKYKKVIQKQ